MLAEEWQLPETMETWEKKASEVAASSTGGRESPGLRERPGEPGSIFTVGLYRGPVLSLDLSFSICDGSGMEQMSSSVLLNSRAALQLRRLEAGPLYLGNMHSSGAHLLVVKQTSVLL